MELVGRHDELDRAYQSLVSSHGVVVTGAMGVGKTLLLDALIRTLRKSNHRVERLKTSMATTDISLWPFQHLMSDVPASSIKNLAYAVSGQMMDLGSNGRVILAIDDANLLDGASIGMLRHLLEFNQFAVAMTVRTDSQPSDGLDALSERFALNQIDIGPFDAMASEQFIENLLHGPSTSDVISSFSQVSRGNPLLLRELVFDALERGGITQVNDMWTMGDQQQHVLDSLGDRTRLWVTRRISRLDQEERQLLDTVAVAGSLRLSLIPEQLLAALERLEFRKLLVVTLDQPGLWTAQVDHPVIAEVVLTSMAGSTELTVRRDLLNSIRSTSRPIAGDAKRAALWAESIGAELELVEWLGATQEAIASFDVIAAERWARRALTVDSNSHVAHRHLGRLLRHQGKLDQAERSFEAAERYATTDEEVTAAAVDRAGLVGLHQHNPAGAIDLLLTASQRVDDPVQVIALQSEAGVLATMLGRFEDALEATPTPQQLVDATDQTRWLLGLNESYVRVMLGRIEGIDELITSTCRQFSAIETERPHELDFIYGIHGAAMLQRGDLQPGVSTLATVWEDHRSSGSYRGIVDISLGLLMDLVSDPRAQQIATDGISQHSWLDPLGTAPVAYAVAALIAVEQGNIDSAVKLANAGHDHGTEPWVSIWIGRARARIDAHRGHRDEAIKKCRDAAEVAITTSHYSYGAVTAHDLVLYGAPQQAVDLLSQAVAPTEGCDFLELLLRHAHASATSSIAQLQDCARDFVRRGATRLGAFAQYQCATLEHQQGREQCARRSEALGRIATHDIGPFIAPVRPVISDALTDRELELAALASKGTSSKDIAIACDLSVRTVDNHLRRAYQKFGVSGRNELHDIFTQLL